MYKYIQTKRIMEWKNKKGRNIYYGAKIEIGSRYK